MGEKTETVEDKSTIRCSGEELESDDKEGWHPFWVGVPLNGRQHGRRCSYLPLARPPCGLGRG